MKRQHHAFLLGAVLGFWTVIAGGVAAAAGAPPVAGVWEMFTGYTELESHIRSGDWEPAAEEMKALEKRYVQLADQLKSVVDAATIQKFRFVIGSLKKRMELRNPEQAEKPLMMLQNLFLDIMDYYDYPTPPGLMLAALWVREAGEYAESRNLAGVREEMEELQQLRQRITDGFKLRNTSGEDIDLFFATVEDVTLAAGDRQAEQVKKGLAELQRLLPEMQPAGAGRD